MDPPPSISMEARSELYKLVALSRPVTVMLPYRRAGADTREGGEKTDITQFELRNSE